MAVCIFCGTANEDQQLKPFKPETWETAKNAAHRRKTLKNDMLFNATQDVLHKTDQPDTIFYHSKCFSRFCAVKRRMSPSTEPSKPMSFDSSSESGNFNDDPEDKCLFCKKKRLRKSNSNESLHKCMTTEGSKAIITAANRRGDTEILELGEVFIAKQAKYHSSCRRSFCRNGDKEADRKSNRKKHEEAFQKLSVFLENEIIKKKTAMLATTIFNLYSEEYFAAGGTQEDWEQYNVQMLMSKVKERLPEIIIDKQSKKRGNFVFPSSITRDDAVAELNKGGNTKEDLIRSAAMALRTEILAINPTKPPSPTSVHNLKETAPAIPHFVSLFYSTLFGGLQADSLCSSSDNIRRRILGSASDALFNCSKGRVRPWKHQALGLGIGTLTGSKSVLNILNRFGHCISYDDVKRLETEIAYTCSAEDRESPDGLCLASDLSTGTLHTNSLPQTAIILSAM